MRTVNSTDRLAEAPKSRVGQAYNNIQTDTGEDGGGDRGGAHVRPQAFPWLFALYVPPLCLCLSRCPSLSRPPSLHPPLPSPPSLPPRDAVLAGCLYVTDTASVCVYRPHPKPKTLNPKPYRPHTPPPPVSDCPLSTRSCVYVDSCMDGLLVGLAMVTGNSAGVFMVSYTPSPEPETHNPNPRS
jgi:hypothetical protein